MRKLKKNKLKISNLAKVRSTDVKQGLAVPQAASPLTILGDLFLSKMS